MEIWQNTDTLIILVSIIIGVMIVLVGTLIAVFYISYRKVLKIKDEELKIKTKYHRSLIRVTLQIQEEERMRIAADLHDNIISKLTIIRLKSATKGLKTKELDELLGATIDESRRISHELSPPLFEENPLENLLVNILKSWKNFYKTPYTVDVRTEKNINKNVKLQLVRILQELINNVHKHANATKISLMLRITDSKIIMILKDDGDGFNDENANGIGIKNIELRVDNLKAKYKFKTKKEIGTRFIFFMNVS